MGFYSDRVLPRIVDRACGTKDLRPHRERACAGLTGHVIEIGFGSGLNVPHYPEAVTEVTAVEPADLGWRLARTRIDASPTPIERSGLDGQSLPFADGSFDTALSTFTMCTIPEVARALSELRRVLKPGGALHFLEHGLAPDEKVRRWQHRLDPIEKRLAGGCVFTCPIDQVVTDAGFTITELDRFYASGGPKLATAFYLGTAVG